MSIKNTLRRTWYFQLVVAVCCLWRDPASVQGSAGYVNAAGLKCSGRCCAYSPGPCLVGNVKAVAGNDYRLLVLKTDGTVWTCGSGISGDGTWDSHPLPVRVPGLSNIIAIAVGEKHSMALGADGIVRTWGDNQHGQLGLPDRTDYPLNSYALVPTPVPDLLNVVSIAAPAHGKSSYAVTADGEARAWGLNDYGQLGNGYTDKRWVPSRITGLSNVVRIIAPLEGTRAFATCSDGSFWAWGKNDSWQLGDGTKINRTAPVPISNLTDCVDVGGRDYNVAVKSDGTLWNWGFGHGGSIPVPIPGMTGMAQVSDGGKRALGIDGTLWTVGWTPTVSPEITGGVGISGGVNAEYVVKEDGTLWTWGGWGCGPGSDSAQPLNGLADVIAVSAGANHALALKTNGTVWAWGDNSNGVLGAGTSNDYECAPVQVQGLTSVIAVAAGSRMSLALKSDGTLWAWGENTNGQLGTGDAVNTRRITPTLISGLPQITSISAGRAGHCLAAGADGTAWAWGQNSSGQLGDGTNTGYRNAPIQVIGLSDVKCVSAGQLYSLALTNDGKVWKWGITPAVVPGLDGIISIATGGGFNLALASNGTVWAWGNNFSGALGDGTTINRTSPVQVIGLANVAMIAAGDDHSMAVKSDGTAWTWGMNAYGALGLPTSQDRQLTPALVPGLAGVGGIAGGSQFSLFVGDLSTLSPTVTGTWPANGQEERSVRYIVVTFDRAVIDVSAEDLTLSNGTVQSVTGSCAGPYLFKVSVKPGQFTASIGGDITDEYGHALPPYQWAFRSLFSDLDGDTDVDSVDTGIFISCASGPNVNHNGTQECQRADLDGDDDVDQEDFGILQRCFSGPGVIPEAGCAD